MNGSRDRLTETRVRSKTGFETKLLKNAISKN
jgi:hypothetical protein